jgi:chemotaxis-related protein WspD
MSLADLLGIDESEGEAATHRHTFAPAADAMGGPGLRAAGGRPAWHAALRQQPVQAPAATINKGLSRFLTGVISHQDMRIGVLDETLIGYQLARTLR